MGAELGFAEVASRNFDRVIYREAVAKSRTLQHLLRSNARPELDIAWYPGLQSHSQAFAIS